MEIMVVTAIGLTGESYFSLIPYLLLLSVLMTFVEIGKRAMRQNERLSIVFQEEGGRSKWSLISAVIVFLILVMALGEWLDLSFILTVVLLIPLFFFSVDIHVREREGFS